MKWDVGGWLCQGCCILWSIGAANRMWLVTEDLKDAYTHVYIHTHAHTRVRICAHTHTHICTRTRMCAQTYTHIFSLPSLSSSPLLCVSLFFVLFFGGGREGVKGNLPPPLISPLPPYALSSATSLYVSSETRLTMWQWWWWMVTCQFRKSRMLNVLLRILNLP